MAAFMSIELRARDDVIVFFEQLSSVYGSDRAREIMRVAAQKALAPVAVDVRNLTPKLTGRLSRAVEIKVSKLTAGSRLFARTGDVYASVGFKGDDLNLYASNSLAAQGVGLPRWGHIAIQNYGSTFRNYPAGFPISRAWERNRSRVLASFQRDWLSFLQFEVARAQNASRRRLSLSTRPRAQVRFDVSVNRYRDFRTGRFVRGP